MICTVVLPRELSHFRARSKGVTQPKNSKEVPKFRKGVKFLSRDGSGGGGGGGGGCDDDFFDCNLLLFLLEGVDEIMKRQNHSSRKQDTHSNLYLWFVHADLWLLLR
jgi:hypothetical protein